jgi:hypothetical protein
LISQPKDDDARSLAAGFGENASEIQIECEEARVAELIPISDHSQV